MIDLIYIEREAADHPRTREICQRFPRATRVICEQYTQVFNPKRQNFRLQKQHPSLILALKQRNFVLPTPDGYGVGGEHNYYFSHMMNCVYDCRYCFLQGMYRSAHYVVFVNFEDYFQTIGEIHETHQTDEPWFFSGYDCDSLALEPVTGFVVSVLNLFESLSSAWLELRTKSTQIRDLLARRPLDNVVVAYSFTPDEVSQALEFKVPKLSKRLKAVQQLADAGWKIGLRFDPIIQQADFKRQYDVLFDQVFRCVDPNWVHSVTIGPFRMPREFHKNILKLYPDEPLFAYPLVDKQGVVSYGGEFEQEAMDYCSQQLLCYIDEKRLFANGF